MEIVDNFGGERLERFDTGCSGLSNLWTLAGGGTLGAHKITSGSIVVRGL